jgi:RNA polymerase primary sigma factor
LREPLTFQAIIIWRDELNEGKVFLRDIIDLEATYAGPDAKATPAPVIGRDGRLIVGIAIPGQTLTSGSPLGSLRLAPRPHALTSAASAAQSLDESGNRGARKYRQAR